MTDGNSILLDVDSADSNGVGAKYVQVRMDPDTKAKIDELAKVKFRGVNRGLAIKWLIEDKYREYQEEKR